MLIHHHRKRDEKGKMYRQLTTDALPNEKNAKIGPTPTRTPAALVAVKRHPLEMHLFVQHALCCMQVAKENAVRLA